MSASSRREAVAELAKPSNRGFSAAHLAEIVMEATCVLKASLHWGLGWRTSNGRLIRFSIFELDRGSGELFRQGRKVKLQGQPFELLVALPERLGEVLTREELRQKDLALGRPK